VGAGLVRGGRFAVLAGLTIQLVVTARDTSVFGGSPLGRALNVFSYFTILSNLIAGGTSLLLALNPARSSTVFRVFRLTGLVAMAVTGLVFHVALSRLLDLDTWAQAANQLLHTVVPVLVVAGWCIFGPRGLTSWRVARLTVLYPLGYGIFEMIRGPLSDGFYNYPFVNVKELGYLRVCINSAWIALLFAGLAAGATALDKYLRTRREVPAPP
jgi:hypothetical protein